MTEKELIGKVHSAVYHQCQRRGYAAPVDVLMEVGVLPKQKYEDWRFGRIDYLERVCTVNLRKLSFIMHQMRVYAQKTGLKPSFCYYKQWGVKKKMLIGLTQQGTRFRCLSQLILAVPAIESGVKLIHTNHIL